MVINGTFNGGIKKENGGLEESTNTSFKNLHLNLSFRKNGKRISTQNIAGAGRKRTVA